MVVANEVVWKKYCLFFRSFSLALSHSTPTYRASFASCPAYITRVRAVCSAMIAIDWAWHRLTHTYTHSHTHTLTHTDGSDSAWFIGNAISRSRYSSTVLDLIYVHFGGTRRMLLLLLPLGSPTPTINACVPASPEIDINADGYSESACSQAIAT